MTSDPAPMFCANHPGVETTLRCNKCGKPICVRCAVRTPTGYRCKECVRGQQKIFDTARSVDFVLGFLAAGFLSMVASLLVAVVSGLIGFYSFFLVIVAAPTAGIAIAEAVRFVTHRHRSRPLFITIAMGVMLGVLPALLWHLLAFDIYRILYQVIYLVFVTPVVYTRLSGIRLTK